MVVPLPVVHDDTLLLLLRQLLLLLLLRLLRLLRLLHLATAAPCAAGCAAQLRTDLIREPRTSALKNFYGSTGSKKRPAFSLSRSVLAPWAREGATR